MRLKLLSSTIRGNEALKSAYRLFVSVEVDCHSVFGSLVGKPYTYRQQYRRREPHTLPHLPPAFGRHLLRHSIYDIIQDEENDSNHSRQPDTAFAYDSPKRCSDEKEDDTGKG